MFIRMTVAANIKATLPTYETTKELMTGLKDRSQTADKSLGSNLMAELTTMKFDGSVSMHDHLLQMTSKAAKLNSLGFTVDDSFLVQFILNSLPQDVWGPFRLTYNIQSERWTVNQLTSKLIEESNCMGPLVKRPPIVNLANDHEASGSKTKNRTSSGKGKKEEIFCRKGWS